MQSFQHDVFTFPGQQVKAFYPKTILFIQAKQHFKILK